MPNAHEHPVCARHGKTRKDVRIRHYFLCDGCCETWTAGPFDGEQPNYQGEKIAGVCLLCNAERKDIRLRTWFLCDICDRVAKSIGRNHVAEEAITDYWQREVAPAFSTLRLERNDVSALRRYDASASTTGVSEIDFLCHDRDKIVFAIENKTGRSPIRGAGAMSQFQLDASDCDCITYAMNKYQVAAYVIHAEVLEIWKPPTWGFYCRSLWWSDVYRMRDNYKSMKMRRDEGRQAVYFTKTAFEPIDTLRAALTDSGELFAKGGKLRLPTLFAERGAIDLYPKA